MNQLRAVLKKQERLVIGLMSGTSTDGVDSAIVRITGSGLSTRFELIDFATFPFKPPFKRKLLALQDKSSVTLEEISRLNFIMGEALASAVLTVCEKYKLPASQIDLIGSHGYTVAHYPSPKKHAEYTTGATMQIGDLNVIAQRTGIVTVGDFRTADIAAGGEGAPLVPYFDFLVFRSRQESRGLLNIGGISNLTVLPKNCSIKEVIAFDCGPGNMLIDQLMFLLFRKKMDRNGKTAARGTISPGLLRWLLSHPFLQKAPPRSTGREEFGPGFAEKVLKKSKTLNLSPHDIIATVSAFTSEAVIHASTTYSAPVTKLDKIIVGGGGVHNTFIMQELSRRAPDIAIESVEGYGISPDAKEAIAFAILANETIAGHPGNVPSATGAYKRAILGKICLP